MGAIVCVCEVCAAHAHAVYLVEKKYKTLLCVINNTDYNFINDVHFISYKCVATIN